MKEPSGQVAGLPRGPQAGRFSATEPVLDRVALARTLGYLRHGTSRAGTPDSTNLPPAVAQAAEAMLSRARELLEPAYVWVAVPADVDARRERVVCRTAGGPVELAVGRIIRGQLHGSQALAAFVVTIGPRLEQEARAMMTGGAALEGYLLDTIGSLAAESVADLLQARIASAVGQAGWRTTNRFSPGYCTWETAGQHALFALLPERPAGVVLGASALMTPIKSVSGVIGLGPDVVHRPYPCEHCGVTGCQHRLTSARNA